MNVAKNITKDKGSLTVSFVQLLNVNLCSFSFLEANLEDNSEVCFLFYPDFDPSMLRGSLQDT